MRRQHFEWTFLVVSLLLMIYGGFFIFYKFNDEDKKIFISAIIAFSIGAILFITYIVLLVISNIQKSKKQLTIVKEEPKVIEEEKIEEVKEEKPAPKQEPVKEEKPVKGPSKSYSSSRSETISRNNSYYASNSYTTYVRKMGYGLVLEVNENIIRDMRSNTYYRIEGNRIYLNGSGLIYQIEDNRIRNLSGRYIFEISGNQIRKIYGGYFADISGNYITKYDLSEKYEMDSRLDNRTLLFISVLLFGEQ